MEDSLSLGIDLGGTKLRGARCENLAGKVRLAAETGSAPAEVLAGNVRRERVGEARDPASVVERVAELIEALAPARDEREALLPPIGVGIAGMPRGAEGFIVEAPNLGWKDVPFGDLLRRRLGPGARLRVVNDVNAVTWGESMLGAGLGSRHVLAVYVGTGVGGGLVCNGQLVEGAAGSAGEIGHFRVVRGPDARRCGCGKLGCVEAYAGGRALGERVRSDLSGPRDSVAVQLAGSVDEVTVTHLDQAASDGDPYASGLWDETSELLGSAIANAVSLVNPERLVLGGGVFWRTPLLRRRVEAFVRGAAVRAAIDSLTVSPSRLGDDAGIVGAALLAEAEPSPAGSMP